VGWSLGLKQKVVQNDPGKLKRGCGAGVISYQKHEIQTLGDT
jgi:hypothetical protein